MLRLSNEQYQALRADAFRRWRERLVGLLREHAEPARAMNDHDLLALIARQEARAAAYGIRTERGLAKWCFMALIMGEGFDQAPEASSFLRDPLLGNPDECVSKLLRSHPAFAGKVG